MSCIESMQIRSRVKIFPEKDTNRYEINISKQWYTDCENDLLGMAEDEQDGEWLLTRT